MLKKFFTRFYFLYKYVTKFCFNSICFKENVISLLLYFDSLKCLYLCAAKREQWKMSLEKGQWRKNCMLNHSCKVFWELVREKKKVRSGERYGKRGKDNLKITKKRSWKRRVVLKSDTGKRMSKWWRGKNEIEVEEQEWNERKIRNHGKQTLGEKK